MTHFYVSEKGPGKKWWNKKFKKPHEAERKYSFPPVFRDWKREEGRLVALDEYRSGSFDDWWSDNYHNKCNKIAHNIDNGLCVLEAFGLPDVYKPSLDKFSEIRRDPAPVNPGLNRPLEMLCALAHYLENGPTESIFGGRDVVYAEEDLVGQNRSEEDIVDSFRCFLSMMFFPRNYRDRREERRLFDEDTQYVLGVLKGNKRFRESLKEITRNWGYVDDDQSIDMYFAVDSKNAFDKWTTGMNVRAVEDYTRKNRMKIVEAYSGKFPELFADFVAGLFGRFMSHDSSRLYTKFKVISESNNFIYNLFGNETCLSCTLGPYGYNYQVAMQQEIDHHMGLLRLIPVDANGKSPPMPAGVMYVIECSPRKNPAWLIDGVDIGHAGFGIEDKLNELLFNAVVNAAESAPTPPERILINRRVKNRASRAFVNHVQNHGSRKMQEIAKIGGVGIFDACEKQKDKFWQVLSKLRRGSGKLKHRHYLEAYHYRTGSVWYPGGPFVADVVEVPIR